MVTAAERERERDREREQPEGQHIPVAIDRFVRDAARVEGLQVAREHEIACPVRNAFGDLQLRVQKLELRLSTLIAFMLGSGLLGGAAGAALVKAMMSGN